MNMSDQQMTFGDTVMKARQRLGLKARVGDVVAWVDVPNGALVQQRQSYMMRHRDLGHVMAAPREWESWTQREACGRAWKWGRARSDGRWVDDVGRWWLTERGLQRQVTGHEDVTIVALGLTGEETAADLRQLAERFERMWTLLEVEDDVTVRIPAWEVARDMETCPRCKAPSGKPCINLNPAAYLGAELYGEVHDERLPAEQELHV